MARISRKHKIETPVVQDVKYNRTALYARLSVEDSGKKDSDSIENQVYLIEQFVEQAPDLKAAGTYIEIITTRLIQFNYYTLDSILGCISWVHKFCRREKNAPKTQDTHPSYTENAPNAPNPKTRKTPPEKLCLKRGFIIPKP